MTAIDWGRVRVREFNPPPRGKGKKPFKVEWVKLPDHWIVQLERSRHLGTYKLALRILRAAFRQQYRGGDIILLPLSPGCPGPPDGQPSRKWSG
jgi:hypothetical protein